MRFAFYNNVHTSNKIPLRIKSKDRGENMAKFKVRSEKNDSVNKTIRFPQNLNERISQIAQENDTTFTSVVLQACEYALDNMGDNTFKDEKDSKG
ncbi:putative uncharacterized protein [Tetragenococcus halophilus subsp. halophilus]|uniref:Uncharacterized protein n=3 Tax=Tetragenococcus halophilus TaxID=51669 RepID=A0A2H6CAR1_TETHA|nr:putative uncharacterized protein [Tetragenococcus halophilus subsp. halophilus]GFK22748.1 hypothetical protein WJ7_22110 [Tetragenococcus halophilus]GMA45365.1 hypothetical protein GCM10025853_28220 [Tetragenococcus halophilus subsp. halophilus DSM 20339]GBD62071.1 putative uncharacterized protein [Tetragenococcus halophilus subsp. halophilus]GBD67899.1 putative uncharacterized protein [Tetragenococcus halophilus subsp. halophilus]